MENQVNRYAALVAIMIALFAGIWIGNSAPEEVNQTEVLTAEIDSTKVADSLAFVMEYSEAMLFVTQEMGRLSAKCIKFVRNDSLNKLSVLSENKILETDSLQDRAIEEFRSVGAAIISKYNVRDSLNIVRWTARREELTE